MTSFELQEKERVTPAEKMEGLRLYWAPTPNCQKIQIALSELGLKYERCVVDLQKRDHASPAFRAINPHQQVPVLEVAGRVFWETGAILLLLAEMFGRLLPRDPGRREEAIMWTFAQASGLGPAMNGLNQQVNLPEDKQNSTLRDHFYRETSKRLGALEAGLSDEREFLAVEYSIADIMYYPYLKPLWAMEVPILMCRPALLSWLERVSQREAIRRLELPSQ